MEATDALRQDHALLRKKLALLESALQLGPEAQLVLREMSFSLLRFLQEHMRREAPVLRYAPASNRSDHATAHRLLRGAQELMMSGMRASRPMIVQRLSEAIDRLQAQMEGQELSIFREVARGRDLPEEIPSVISGAMSVNEILQRYPKTERVFEQLRINRLREGYESVDELAWRHGMDVSEVLEQLRQLTAHSSLAN